MNGRWYHFVLDAHNLRYSVLLVSKSNFKYFSKAYEGIYGLAVDMTGLLSFAYSAWMRYMAQVPMWPSKHGNKRLRNFNRKGEVVIRLIRTAMQSQWMKRLLLSIILFFSHSYPFLYVFVSALETRQMKREKADQQLELAMSNLGWNEQMFLLIEGVE